MESVVLFSFIKHIEQASAMVEEIGLNIIKVFKKSLMSDPIDQMCEVVYYMEENHIDKLVIPSCLTISTNVSEFVSFIHTLEQNGLSLVILDPKIDAIDKGEMNPQFKTLIDIMSEFDTAQQKLMMKRIQKAHTAYREYINNGGKVGRKSGFRKHMLKYRRDYAREISLLRSGVSMKQCHRQTGVSINTLKKLKSMFIL